MIQNILFSEKKGARHMMTKSQFRDKVLEEFLHTDEFRTLRLNFAEEEAEEIASSWTLLEQLSKSGIPINVLWGSVDIAIHFNLSANDVGKYIQEKFHFFFKDYEFDPARTFKWLYLSQRRNELLAYGKAPETAIQQYRFIEDYIKAHP